jgi:SAM-dependent methyltransferase
MAGAAYLRGNGQRLGDAMRCPLCSSKDNTVVTRLDKVPTMVNRLMRTPEAARACPHGTIRLVLCGTCGHFYNEAFASDGIVFDGNYGNALHGSPTYRSHSWQLARLLVRDHHWTHQDLLDIGCGQGYFLRLLCALGANQGIGVDPASTASSWQQSGAMGGQIRIIKTSFNEKTADLPGEKVICQHLFEHLESPSTLLELIRNGGPRKIGHDLLIEVPNGLFTFRDNGIWDLIHEHVSYFTPRSLVGFLKRSGYSVRLCRESYGRQFITVLAQHDGHAIDRIDLSPDRKGVTEQLANSFESRFLALQAQWNQTIREWSESGRRLFLWGAGSKGVNFVNLIDEPSRIEALVDQNSQKQGRFVPGTGHAIISPIELAHPGDNVILVMNALYLREVEATLHRHGIEARCVSVMAGPRPASRAAMPAFM